MSFSLRWLPGRNGSTPPNAVVAGHEQSGEKMYIARAKHEGAVLPGKVVPAHGKAYVAWGGAEHPKDDYEVLCDISLGWVPMSGFHVPSGAVQAGRTENGEILYVGRANHNQSLTSGKVQPSQGVCYIPFGGQEIAKKDFEVLVLHT